MKPVHEVRSDLLADSQATLRQVGAVVEELDGADGASGEAGGATADLLQTLLKAYTEVIGVIDGLRRSRSSLNRATVHRLQSTNAKLDEVSSATEVAVSDMLDGLDQALARLDRLDEISEDRGEGSAAERAESRLAIRGHLDGVVNLLQFQDITSQQLGYASGVLNDVERRLASVASVLAESGGVEAEIEADDHQEDLDVLIHQENPTCDPHASADGSESRQAVADEIFGAP